MACNQSTKSIVSIPKPSNLPNTPSASPFEQTTRFLCSDNPETINSSTTTFTNGFATLWSDTVSGSSSVRYRVFAWHYNSTVSPMKFGITVGNAGTSSYSIHNLRNAIEVRPFGQIGDLGRCAASALIGNTMDSITPTDSSAPIGGIGVVREWIVGAGQLVGGVIEFTISNTTPNVGMNYRVRTVMANSSTANLRLNQTPVVNYFVGQNNSIHPRGSWGFAGISSSVAYEAAASGQKWEYHSISNNATDNLQTETNSYRIQGAPSSQGPASSNKGHYGLKYNLAVTLTNRSQVQKTIKIYLAARGADSYFGAVQWSGDGITYKVPTLAPANATSSNQNAIEVASVTLNPGVTINRIITISNAGGAATPVLVAFQTV
ncbi:hypothetical protein BTS2_0308 [Bacillus sp. TS-2]|nr:hypothetical protein BTS2_0308 [Bacillus sp. TS-2]